MNVYTKRKRHLKNNTRKFRKKPILKFYLKGGFMDEEDPLENIYEFIKQEPTDEIQKQELIKYFCSETSHMTLKSDITKIIHKMPEIRETCVQLAQNVHTYLFNKWNPLASYIFSTFDENVLDTFTNVDNTYKEQFKHIKVLFHSFDWNPTDDFMSMIEKNEEFTKRLDINVLENVLSVFYRFYLKGGSAMLFLIDSYINTIRSEMTDIQKYILSEEEIEMILGGYSDYDFNFVINPLLPRERLGDNHHDKLHELSILYLYNLLINLIYSPVGDLFRNQSILNTISDKLKQNVPRIDIDTYHRPENIGYIYKSVKNPELQKQPNHKKLNFFAEITISQLEFENVFRMERNYRDNKFSLVRLLGSFKNNTIPTLSNGTPACISDKTKPVIYGELIDISIPHLDSHEIFEKWEESKNIINIKGISVYNLSAIIHDLERVVEENKKKGDPKLAKREKRLMFFYHFACVLPSLIHSRYKDDVPVFNACGSLFDKIIETKSSVLTKENRDSILYSLIGIYGYYPESIRTLDLFMILKYYFINYINANHTSFEKGRYYELASPFTKTNIPEFWTLEYKETGFNKQSSFFTLFQLGPNNTIVKIIDIQYKVLEYVHLLIDRIQKQYEVSENKIYIEKALSVFLIEFNNIFRSINDNTIVHEVICKFIQTLNLFTNNIELSEINETYSEYFIGQSLFIMKENLYEKQQIKETLNKNFVKQYVHSLLLQSMLIPHELELKYKIQSRILLKGGLLYDIYNSIQTAFLKNQDAILNINTNDIDFFLYLNIPQHMFLNQNDGIIETIFNSFKKLEAYFNKQRTNRRITMKLIQSSNTVFYIQIMVYDYIPLNNFSNEVFDAVLGSGGIPKENTFRIIETHSYELYIINIPKDVKPEEIPRYKLSSFTPELTLPNGRNVRDYLIVQKWNNLIKGIFDNIDIIKNEIIPVGYQLPTKLDLYVDSLIDIKKSYDEILIGHKDVLKKHKYVKRLLGKHTI
jgi:hypothetical protein